MLARVHGHCGCAAITSVGRSFASWTVEFAGHDENTWPILPGEFSYLSRACPPQTAVPAQARPNITVRMILIFAFIIGRTALYLEHGLFQMAKRVPESASVQPDQADVDPVGRLVNGRRLESALIRLLCRATSHLRDECERFAGTALCRGRVPGTIPAKGKSPA